MRSFGVFAIVASHWAVAASAISSSTECACSRLFATLERETIFPNSTSYSNETHEYWDVRSAQKPACIVLPKNPSQVVSVVKTLHQCNSQFAVRGGGHMNYPGSNNIDDGVLLALNSLNNMTLSADKSTIGVGPGNRWVDVYDALGEHGLYAIGGRLKTIGVPGLTLIGGFHYFNNKYGYAMDNVVSYDVVLGNGTQVTASGKSHADLFWALKGGANNYGIVTRFELKTHKVPKISTTIQSFNESAVEAFIEASCDLAENNPADIAAGSVISITYNATTGVVSPSLLGVQEGTESPPSRFRKFSAIPSTYRKDNVTVPTVWHSTLESPNQMFRVQFGHKTMLPDAARLFEMYKIWKSAVDDIKDVKGLYPTFVFNIMPKSAAAVAQNNGIGNVWGLEDTDSLIIWQFSTGWDDAQDDLRMTSWTRNLLDHLHSENQAKGLAHDFIYAGDAGEFQNPYITYPLKNVERMRAIRHVYDSDKTFSKLNWGGFKLGW